MKATIILLTFLFSILCGYGQKIDAGNEELMLDTFTQTPSAEFLPSWFTPDGGDGFSDGSTVGLSLPADTAFMLTRAEYDVTLANPEALENTKFQIAYFRNTNHFRWAAELEPMFYPDKHDTNWYSLVSRGNGRYTLNVAIDRCIIGTNRIYSIRTLPIDEYSPFARLKLARGNGQFPAGTAIYVSQRDGATTIDSIGPAVRLWKRSVQGVGLSYRRYDKFTALLQFDPGVMIGRSAAPDGPWEWESTDGMFGEYYVEMNWDDSGFFRVLPDVLP